VNFVQVEFLVFFAAVFAAYWLLQRRAQNLLLVFASCVFYGWIHPHFLIMLGFSSYLDFTMARAMVYRPRYKRAFLVLSLTGNLGMLAFFKYFDWFIVEVATVLGTIGLQPHLSTLGVLLPVGISFYTFQTMGYTIDVYRGELKPRRNLLDYLVFVSFFPQLVAGPIERAGRLLPQIETDRVFVPERVRSGMTLALWGFFKKVAIADTIAPYVDKVFTLVDPSGPLVWVATVGFMLQIYADFSGYTDIARGTARMLGFELMENFRSPHLATSTPDFWRRWHISLSTWLRDYLLAPLLGDVAVITIRRFVVAVTITFVLVGLWHGASWNFVVFGLFHGMWMCFYVAWDRYVPARFKSWPGARWAAITWHFVAVLLPASLLFREQSVMRAWEHMAQNPIKATDEEWMVAAALLAITSMCMLPLALASWIERVVVPPLQRRGWLTVVQTTAWSLAALAIFVFKRDVQYDFVYFQF